MWEPPWKKLVEKLKAEEFESTYLDRLDRRLTIATERASLEREIIEEMGYALRKSSDKVNLLLLELDVLRHEFDTSTDVSRRRRKLEEFNLKRQEAMRARWELMVHREAIGFLRNDELELDYPIPPPLRLEAHSPKLVR